MRAKPIDFTHEHDRPLPTSPRGHEIALGFGLTFDGARTVSRRLDQTVCPPVPGQILFIGGASGSGKSSVLRSIARRAHRATVVINLRRIALDDRPVIDLFEEESIAGSLGRLSRVGLAEVWTWLRRPRELSEGQRWRLRLALALRRAEAMDRPATLVCDEFAALLDRVSACIIASAVRRAVDDHATKLGAILATSHDDLHRALDPDIRIDCDFGVHQLTRRKRRAR